MSLPRTSPLTSRNRRKNIIKHKVLESDELPSPGTVIAIDAEFVVLQQVSVRNERC